MIVGVLHPGQMGSALGAVPRNQGHLDVNADSPATAREIADTFVATGRPDGFRRAAAPVHRS